MKTDEEGLDDETNGSKQGTGGWYGGIYSIVEATAKETTSFTSRSIGVAHCMPCLIGCLIMI